MTGWLTERGRGVCIPASGFIYVDACLSAMQCIQSSAFSLQTPMLPVLSCEVINPRSLSSFEAEISQMFSHMQHDVSEALSNSQHMNLVGDFNAHLDNLPDHFPKGHVAMLSRFPELGTTRLGQYKGRANTARRCLRDIALESPLILTTGRGKGGTTGSLPSLVTTPLLTHHGLNTSWCPLPFLCAANKSAYYMNLTQQTTDHFYATFHASVR